MARTAAALAAAVFWAGPALASNQIYDFGPLLNEPHPFAGAQQPYVGYTGAGPGGLAPVAPPPPTYRHSPPPGTAAQAQAQGRGQPRRGGADDSLFGEGFDSIFRRVYLAAAAGLHMPDDLEATAPAGVGFEIEQDDGLAAAFAIGRYFGQSVRGELEVSWRASDSAAVTSLGAAVADESELTTAAVMVNLYYDVRFGWPIAPYLGLGLGAAQVESDDVNDGFGNVGPGKDSTEFAWQAIAGFAWEFGPRFALTGDYRYFATGDDDITSHTFLAGLRFNL
jgi:opacity protein-like surface antigen